MLNTPHKVVDQKRHQHTLAGHNKSVVVWPSLDMAIDSTGLICKACRSLQVKDDIAVGHRHNYILRKVLLALE